MDVVPGSVINQGKKNGPDAPLNPGYATIVLEIKNGWMVETGGLPPVLRPDPFFREVFDFSDTRIIGNRTDRVRISYQLPQTGTTIRAGLESGSIARSAHQGSEQEKTGAKHFSGGVRYTAIDISRDMDRGRFTVGGRGAAG